jgi:hypothetical protein
MRDVRTVIREVIADIDAEAAEIILAIHWMGDLHTEVRLPRRRRGQRNSTSADIIAAVRHLVLIANDDLIAGIRVARARHSAKYPTAHPPDQQNLFPSIDRWVARSELVIIFPIAERFARVIERDKQRLVQQLVPEPAIETLDEGILGWLA